MYFQNGLACLNYLDAGFDTALTQSEIDDQDDEWMAIDILRDVGIHESSITQIVALIALPCCCRLRVVTALCVSLLRRRAVDAHAVVSRWFLSTARRSPSSPSRHVRGTVRSWCTCVVRYGPVAKRNVCACTC